MRKVSIITLAAVFALFTLGFATATDNATQTITLNANPTAAIDSPTDPGSLSTTKPSAGEDFGSETGTAGTLKWTVNGTGSLETSIGSSLGNGVLTVEVDTSVATKVAGTTKSSSGTATLGATPTTVINTVSNEALTGVATNYTWYPTVKDGTGTDNLTVTFTLSGVSGVT